MKKYLSLGAIALAAMLPIQAMAEWKPSGPITLDIGFRAGGGADTQARLIGQELTERFGWTIAYKNTPGKGGGNLARAMKEAPNDGLSIAIAVTDTVTYNPLVSDKAGFTHADFDYIITTAPTQMGLVARADSGWTSLADLAAAGQTQDLKFAVMAPRLADGAYVIAKSQGIKFNHVNVKGGRGVLNGLMASDVDVGFVAGIHVKGVEAGDLVNLASAEATRLTMSPEVPTLMELGIPYSFGVSFLVFGPKGMPEEAKAGIAAAISEILSDDASEARKFILRAMGTPPLVSGAELDQHILDLVEQNKDMLASIE